MEQELKVGPGRPALPPEQKRKQKNFRLSPDTIALIEGIAAVNQMNDTEIVEKAVSEFAKRNGVELAEADV
ncbi:hypothetical protein EON83_20325 [bacterium]|nr:MAG: hypothetical protein EON83_20325 [bacterium]